MGRSDTGHHVVSPSDPLLNGPVPPAPGARINAQDQVSASEPTFTVDAGMVGAATAAPDGHPLVS